MAIDIKFDSDDLRAMVVEGILANLTGEMQHDIFKQAVTDLMKPVRHSYGTESSPLQDAFNTAIRKIAVDLATELIENDEDIKNEVRTAIRTTIKDLAGNMNMSTAIAEGLRKFLKDDW